MKQQSTFLPTGKKLSRDDMKKIKGGTTKLACTMEQQEECSNECAITCGGFCNQFCRCIC